MLIYKLILISYEVDISHLLDKRISSFVVSFISDMYLTV